MKDSLEFYNQFDKKLITDFVLGNKRIEKAIKNLGSRIPNHSDNILDIGCGIGWSTYEFAKIYKNAQVEGIDLSPVLIEIASKLFKRENLRYANFDITRDIPQKEYDAIIMIDVYEHIPVVERLNFHRFLKTLIRQKGQLLVSCPTKFHQDYLRKYNPDGLQPVDEDVEIDDIQIMARNIGGELVYFEYQTVWRTNDYFHCAIEISPQYSKFSSKKGNRIILETPLKRKELVKSVFGNLYSIPTGKESGFLSVVKKIKKKLR
ncbi:class I SAM-dependent methyltransferase [Aegicerativicinus sediminis]|uniref:class I SAM-dependent methyltransferase n=1 Tax=Aegicerativicinus sediminis TaxID=2893202 RepID=UPI001E522198|nr:class I SAM-dependent methyltransferase [Aegicerativicinus sediminis]